MALHVMPYRKGWVVKRAIEETPSVIIETKAEALQLAKRLAFGDGETSILFYEDGNRAPMVVELAKRRARALEQPQSMKVLFVDDDEVKSYTACRSLRYAGYQVTAAVSARSALPLIESSSPQVVISDIRMAEMDGYELCRQIKKSNPAIPVLLVSAHIPNLEELKACGAEGFIEGYDIEPIRMVEAITRITNIRPAS